MKKISLLLFTCLLTMALHVQSQVSLSDFKYGYINKTGKVIIEPEFDICFPFDKGKSVAHIGDKEKWSKMESFILDENGTRTSPPQIEEKNVKALKMTGDVWEVKKVTKKEGSFYGFADKNGKLISELKYKSIYKPSEGFLMVKDVDGHYGFCDLNGNEVIKPIYKYAESFSDGLAKVRKDDKWGYIDNKGELQIPFTYNNAKNFKEGLAAVSMDGKLYGYINKEGKIVVDYKYGIANEFSEGLAGVWIKDEDGNYFKNFINQEGETVIETTYKDIGQFGEGMAAFTEDGKFWGFINKKGEIVIEAKFSARWSWGPKFVDGLAIAGPKSYQYGFINKKGEYEIPPIFRWIEPFKNNIAVVQTLPRQKREEFFKSWLNK